MQIKTQINTLFNKRMGRKEFIKHILLGVVVLSGVGAALRLLSGHQTSSHDAGNGGGSAYGGGSGVSG
jgi:hypothetical protein